MTIHSTIFRYIIRCRRRIVVLAIEVPAVTAGYVLAQQYHHEPTTQLSTGGYTTPPPGIGAWYNRSESSGIFLYCGEDNSDFPSPGLVRI